VTLPPGVRKDALLGKKRQEGVLPDTRVARCAVTLATDGPCPECTVYIGRIAERPADGEAGWCRSASRSVFLAAG
jgi:hypothetical protein